MTREAVTVSSTEWRNVWRCDKCSQVIRDRSTMTVAVFSRVPEGTRQVRSWKYHLCEACGFSEQFDMDERRKRVLGNGVTAAEQEALLKGLFAKKRSLWAWRKR